ncbi:acyl-CoA thioesterase [Psychroserpens sp. Hel_I_66]|uniref:acyl-CoA thioesterase n=1 Tax=Psychroserpens sp. Hel_I_66 TaxID=1250004 RepID=UPI00064656ED|nr:thioesterase family protein [Psychroserpens sp. Hel_I_66]
MENLSKSDEIQFRVRYGETDQMGIVYHGNYAQYFEMGRTEWLRKMGFSYKNMEDEGVMLPVISLSINYKKSARYDDLIKVKTILVKKPGVKIEFDYEISNQDGEILTTGNSVLVFMDINKNRPTRCPDYILDKLLI